MSGAVETPIQKQNFDWIYCQENPTAYKTEILDLRTYICDNATRKEFDRKILPVVERLVAQRDSDGSKVRVTDLGCCFGNTTMALIHGMTTAQIQENWMGVEECEKVNFPRRFPCVVTGIDLSENALKYCKRTGIADETLAANLNTGEGLKKVMPAMRGTDLLIATAALVYLNVDSVETLIQEFAAGLGEGYAVVNFLNPFELEKTDEMKSILLKHLEFVGSTASRHRTLSAHEMNHYGDYGDWALLEIWTLKRRGAASQRCSPMLNFAPPARLPDVIELSTDEKFDPTSPASPSKLHKSPSYHAVNVPPKASIKQALVVAATQLSSLDSLSGPKCLIRLGNLPIICHVLVQLQHAGVERAVVLCGFKGQKIREVIERDLDEDCKGTLTIDFVDVGDSWHRGSAYSILEASHSFASGDRFLMCMADHIFDPAIIGNMRAVPFSRTGEAFCLVETDFDGMVGMAATSVKVQLDQTDLSDVKVKAICRNLDLKSANGVDAGLFACDTSVFKNLELLASRQAYFSLADAMSMYVTDGLLYPVKVDGKMWFAVETKEALAFAVADGLKQIGTVPEDVDWLSDGAYDQDGNRIPVVLSGHGKELKPGGSKWSEFTVERWRSAVYINLSYFKDLCDDTIDFITEIAKHMKLRGQRVSLVEVGCGTGEFIRPIADQFRIAIGVDFNKAFVEFCNEHIPTGKEEKMLFVNGDACELVELMQQKAPTHFWGDTRIVTCVGNTIGIIPANLKERVYKQMTELAGADGVIIIAYWNARWFGDACQNFYHANPQLCGPFTGDSIDFNTATLTTPAPWNYRSHWTSVEEARGVLRSLGLEEIVVEEKGKGVLVAARMNTRSD